MSPMVDQWSMGRQVILNYHGHISFKLKCLKLNNRQTNKYELMLTGLTMGYMPWGL